MEEAINNKANVTAATTATNPEAANTIKENDFVELEYTGKIADTGEVFDTTSAAVAKENKIFDERMAYEPAVICVGKRHLIIGLDNRLVGKEVGKTYTFKIAAEEAFGKKNAKLIQLISTAKFRQRDLTPFPGLQVNIDGIVGTVKTVTGGRTIVDFNHPLASKELEYEVSVKRIVTDLSEKARTVLRLIGINTKSVGVSAINGSVTLEFDSEVPEPVRKDIEEKLKSTITELNAVYFVAKKDTATTATTQPQQQPL